MSSDREKDLVLDLERLAYAKIEGPGVTLAFMADNKTHVRAHFPKISTPLNQKQRKNL